MINSIKGCMGRDCSSLLIEEMLAHFDKQVDLAEAASTQWGL